MKSLKVFGLVIVLVFSATIFAQEKEKPKEVEKSKEVEKPKEVSKSNVLEGFRTSNDPSHWRFFGVCNRKFNANASEGVPDVTDLELSETILTLSQSIKSTSENTSDSESEKSKIEVFTKVKNPNDDTLTYNYTVSSGRIIGAGEKVIWDLSNVKPGTYTITAAVDDGCGFCGKRQTKTVIVKE